MKTVSNQQSHTMQQKYRFYSLIRKCLTTVSTCFLIAFTNAGSADQTNRDLRYFEQVPSTAEIAEQLFPRRTRGIVINKPTAKPKSVERSVALPVLFHFGKTTLVETSKPYLDRVGEFMLEPAYAKETLIIEGHTDSVGSETYNRRLSELRALAVKDYLINRYGIDPLRLFPAGKGETQLYDQSNPKSGKNRRVEFLRYGANS